jgi:hypothetical protein
MIRIVNKGYERTFSSRETFVPCLTLPRHWEISWLSPQCQPLAFFFPSSAHVQYSIWEPLIDTWWTNILHMPSPVHLPSLLLPIGSEALLQSPSLIWWPYQRDVWHVTGQPWLMFAGLRGRICCPNPSYNWILFSTYPSSDIHLYSKGRN